MNMRTHHLMAPIAALGLVAGCGNEGPPGAGLTNGPPPVADEKPAVRSDLPVAIPTGPGTGEPLGRTGDGASDAGTGGRGAGDSSARPGPPGAKAADDSVRAAPPAVEAGSPNSAAGGTRPAEEIKTGTPRSPQ